MEAPQFVREKCSPVLLRVRVHGANPGVRILLFHRMQLEGEGPPLQTQICNTEITAKPKSAMLTNRVCGQAPPSQAQAQTTLTRPSVSFWLTVPFLQNSDLLKDSDTSKDGNFIS